MYEKYISKNSFKKSLTISFKKLIIIEFKRNLLLKKLLRNFDGRRRYVLSAAVNFHTNLLSTETVRATGTLCSVPLYCPLSSKGKVFPLQARCGPEGG